MERGVGSIIGVEFVLLREREGADVSTAEAGKLESLETGCRLRGVNRAYVLTQYFIA